MKFKGIQKTFKYIQSHQVSPDQVFPLLCPVREADWIDGWEYEMIYSKSGYAEQDCVFTTPHADDLKTVWQVTAYNPESFEVEFVRVTPQENIVKIKISVEPFSNNSSKSHISYQYTGLNTSQNDFIENRLPGIFKANMEYWEAAINHYLKTGEKLKREAKKG